MTLWETKEKDKRVMDYDCLSAHSTGAPPVTMLSLECGSPYWKLHDPEQIIWGLIYYPSIKQGYLILVSISELLYQ